MIGKWTCLLTVTLSSIGSAPQKAVEAPLCAIVLNPHAYSGRIVRFRAAVLTDWHHGIVLFSQNCRGGIQLASTDDAPPAEAAALDDAVGTPLNGGYDRTAVATFTGRIEWRQRSPRPHFYNPLAITVYRVSRVKVQPRMRPH